MSHLIFKLNGVPDDEANDIRLLLDEAEIAFYETDSGRWGLGYAAIWMREKNQLDNAKTLIQDYQTERYQRVKSEHDAIEQSGDRVSRLEFFLSSPIRYSLLVIFAALLGYFTVVPFFK